MSLRRSNRLSVASSVKEDLTNVPTPPKIANTSRKRKSAPQESMESLANGNDTGPSTPKRKKASMPILPPVTPTPAAIGLMSAPLKGMPAASRVNRLAAPDGTNATLLTPETHSVIAAKPLDEVSPTKASNAKTTANILGDALAHLIKVEPKMKPIIDKHPCKVFSPAGLAEEVDPFNSLVSGIISQQAGAAAKSIKAKFVGLFNSDSLFPTPSQVCAIDIPTLRTAGLSQRKAEYVHGLAEKFNSGELTTSMLFNAPYEEVFEELIKVRGLGKWSVEMFACFSLKRMDVFSTGDLGVQRGMAAFKGRDVAKLKNGKGKWKYMSEKEMEEMAENFRPYRSVFMWYMWRVEDVDISSFDQYN
ncbi:3MEA DNA glycosylase [Hyphodiscus hymeniophilus]|uniref:3MEA DNA glycosylase n=1 Tax=Hyphodiscus hymeniophilus TaxID=353542 RepID=A0A9P6VPT0_9HELO|nr:3MEA DNA glycosylase [Hyphodiscus hymeniophilus]